MIRIIDAPKNILDIPIPTATLDAARQYEANRAAHYDALAYELKLRDAERIKNRAKENDSMAIKVIDVQQRQMPRSKVGKFSTLNDVQEAVSALKNLGQGKAVEISVDQADYDRLKKDGTKDPARSIVNMLKRKFTNDGLSFKVYASNDKTITILHAPSKGKK